MKIITSSNNTKKRIEIIVDKIKNEELDLNFIIKSINSMNFKKLNNEFIDEEVIDKDIIIKKIKDLLK